MSKELYNFHRPKLFKEIEGNKDAVRVLNNFVRDENIPHAILFYGPTGCGKTTLASILADKLTEPMGIHEANCGTIKKPLEYVQTMEEMAIYPTLSGQPQVWILDEFQALSRAPFAQQGCLKLFEKPPSHAYFFLCSTDPSKIIPAIRSRCTPVQVGLLDSVEMDRVMARVLKAEGKTVPIDVFRKIVEVAEGHPRKALVLLEKVVAVKSEAEQLSIITKGDFQTAGIDLAKALLNNQKWPTIAKIILSFEEVEPEDARRTCMGYCRAVMLKNFKLASRCNQIIESMREPYYDVGNAAACLASSCYELCGKK